MSDRNLGEELIPTIIASIPTCPREVIVVVAMDGVGAEIATTAAVAIEVTKIEVAVAVEAAAAAAAEALVVVLYLQDPLRHSPRFYLLCYVLKDPKELKRSPHRSLNLENRQLNLRSHSHHLNLHEKHPALRQFQLMKMEKH